MVEAPQSLNLTTRTTMITMTAKGKTNVATERGEALTVEPTVGQLVLSNGERIQVKRAFVDALTNATTELVPAVAGATLRVCSLIMLHGDTAGTVILKSATTAISPTFSNAVNGGMVLPFNPYGWFQTTAINEALNVTVSASSNCAMIINYIEITDDLMDLL